MSAFQSRIVFPSRQLAISFSQKVPSPSQPAPSPSFSKILTPFAIMTLVTRSAYRLSRRAAVKNAAAFSTAAAKVATPAILNAVGGKKVEAGRIRAKEGESSVV